MYFGWADPQLNPMMGVEYYEKVQEKMGSSTASFFRLFMVPGMFHCQGGAGTGVFDAATPLLKRGRVGGSPGPDCRQPRGPEQGGADAPAVPLSAGGALQRLGSVDDAANSKGEAAYLCTPVERLAGLPINLRRTEGRQQADCSETD